jgi:peptidoglycan DL-endopeptidase CwlO
MTYRPLPVRLSSRAPSSARKAQALSGVERFRGTSSRQALAFFVGLVAVLLTAGPAFGAPSIGAKQAEAQRIMAELQEIDGQLGQAIEAYNLATTRLEALQTDLRANTRRLGIAKSNLKVAQSRLSDRVVSLYKGGDVDSTLEVVLGAESLQDLITRLDTAGRVSSHDSRVMAQVRSFRVSVAKTQKRLKRAEKAQRALVAQRESQRRYIENRLAERRSLLSSVKNEIAQLQAEERAREAELARQMQARLATQQEQQAVAVLSVGDEVTAAAEDDGGTASDEASSPAIAAPPSSPYGGVVGIAMQYLGVPYVWGGASPSGFDCSGFTMYVYAKVGVSLPHNAAMQFGVGVPVSRDQLQPGDLVFFNGLGHMGMYIGGGNFIHAPHTGDVVKVSALSGWYDAQYVGARRVL